MQLHVLRHYSTVGGGVLPACCAFPLRRVTAPTCRFFTHTVVRNCGCVPYMRYVTVYLAADLRLLPLRCYGYHGLRDVPAQPVLFVGPLPALPLDAAARRWTLWLQFVSCRPLLDS